jgi:hypothetical protein
MGDAPRCWTNSRRSCRDPAGIATGDKTSTSDAGGTPFVVPEPTDKNAPDYAKAKQAFDEFQTQAAKEPLAVKLADNVGHLRIATNFSWTLLTGYLVLFMQAGFALLTCGLVRKKNAGHLMMLNSSYLGKAGQGVTGLLYGDSTQFFTQVGGATLMAICAFGLAYVVFSLVNAVRSTSHYSPIVCSGGGFPLRSRRAAPSRRRDRRRRSRPGDSGSTLSRALHRCSNTRRARCRPR